MRKRLSGLTLFGLSFAAVLAPAAGAGRGSACSGLWTAYEMSGGAAVWAHYATFCIPSDVDAKENIVAVRWD